jgi:hypothetical protein
MHLGIGLGITRLSGVLAAAPAFSPLDLFGSGEEGAWYDPSDLSTVWQDSAGTIPATAGDPVGRIDDKSGNNNHATQSTPTARPTLQVSGGLYYLDFDGVDDFIEKGAFSSIQSQPNTLAVAWKFDSLVATFSVIFDSDPSGRHLFREGSGIYTLFSGAAVSFGTADLLSNVAVVHFNSPQSTVRINGSVELTSSNTGSSGWTGATLGTHNTSAGNFTDGRIYGYIGVNRTLTASEIDGVESYLAAKSGVTL